MVSSKSVRPLLDQRQRGGHLQVERRIDLVFDLKKSRRFDRRNDFAEFLEIFFFQIGAFVFEGKYAARQRGGGGVGHLLIILRVIENGGVTIVQELVQCDFVFAVHRPELDRFVGGERDVLGDQQRFFGADIGPGEFHKSAQVAEIDLSGSAGCGRLIFGPQAGGREERRAQGEGAQKRAARKTGFGVLDFHENTGGGCF